MAYFSHFLHSYITECLFTLIQLNSNQIRLPELKSERRHVHVQHLIAQ